ncbi:MAG: type IX secretion system sortase PorU, partial [Bacteroidales bacterium]
SGIGSKKRISSVDNSSLIPNQTVSEYTHYNFYEQDTRVLAETGREWFGDAFDINTSRTYSFSLPGYKPNSARVSVSAASAYSGSSLFEVTVNGNSVGRMLLPACTSNKIFGTLSESDFSFTPNAASLTVGLTYNKPSSSAVAYLDWIEIQATCNLSMHSAQFPFCNVEVIGENNIALFSVSNANSATMIWDVTVPTEPVQMMGTLSNHVFQFKTLTQSLKKFVAFNGTQYYSITPIGSVSRQNLHGESMVDMVIVAYPDFMSQAERLAEYRRENNGLSVKVVTPQQVYNEFSSGSQDPTAIRDYMKMIYEKSNKLYPRYLLLFGRPSFDYRERISGNKLFVPNWQNKAVGSINEYAFRANDDYFGILGDADGEGCKGYIEVAIGRFPVVNAAQAKLAVDKSIQYTTSKNLVTNVNSTQISNLADWRNVITFIADDEDHNTHINTADQCAQLVANSNKNINLDKIYCDAYQQVSNSGGQRYPDVNKAINNRMDRGTLYLSYIGHSGVDGWAHERILEFSDINKWTNQYNQPLIMTLSCDFGWYDRKITSPAEVAFFNSKGGSSVMITTSRVAYTSSNDGYARKLFASLFKKENNQYKTVGEINMYAKNEYGGAQSSLNMIYLMGDPSMPLPIPQFKVITDSINGLSIHEKMDTARALSKVTITGRVVDDNGNTLTDFNGNLFPSVFDKKTTVHT